MKKILLILIISCSLFAENTVVINMPRTPNDSTPWIIGFDGEIFTDSTQTVFNLSTGNHAMNCCQKTSPDTFNMIFDVSENRRHEIYLNKGNISIKNSPPIIELKLENYTKIVKTYKRIDFDQQKLDSLVVLHRLYYDINVDWLLYGQDDIFCPERKYKITLSMSQKTLGYDFKIKDPAKPFILMIYPDRIIYFKGKGIIYKDGQRIVLPTKQMEEFLDVHTKETFHFSKKILRVTRYLKKKSCLLLSML